MRIVSNKLQVHVQCMPTFKVALVPVEHSEDCACASRSSPANQARLEVSVIKAIARLNHRLLEAVDAPKISTGKKYVRMS